MFRFRAPRSFLVEQSICHALHRYTIVTSTLEWRCMVSVELGKLLGSTQIVVTSNVLTGWRKTRIALEAAYKWKRLKSTSIFWVHASTRRRVEKDYLDIAQEVGIVGWDSPNPQIDILRLVKDWFEKTALGHWILILDNADDADLLFGSSRLADYFPRSLNGAILLTTRNKLVASNSLQYGSTSFRCNVSRTWNQLICWEPK